MRRLLAVSVMAAVLVLGRGSATLAAEGSFPAPSYRTKHVIVAVMDGVRWSETFGDPQHRYVPRMWKELVPQGTLYTNFYNRGVTVTRQGHSTIASGTYQVVPNGGPRLTRPTFFDYFREETGAPAEKAWVIFGKGAYSFAPWSSFPAYLDKYAPRAVLGVGEGSSADDHEVFAKAVEVMKQYKPNLMFLNFGYTDHIGHRGTFAEYTQAIAEVDALFADLWQAIQADPEYRDSTTLILTNDHGRHDDAHGGFHGHGDGDEGCRHVFLLLLGPDAKQGAVIAEPAEQVDIAPTVGELLGFQTPLAEGRVLAESFRSYLGLNQKAARTATEKQAVRTAQLAARDLGRVVSHHTLQDLGLASLSPGPGPVILFRGLLAQARASQRPEGQLAFQAVRDWLDRTKEAKGKAQLYRALVALDASRDYLKDADFVSTDWSDEVDRAFLVDLLARAGAVERLGQAIASLAKEPARPQPGSAPTPHEPALVLYALSDALQELESAGLAARSGLQATVAELRRAALLRYYRAVQDQIEPGGLWEDPVDSVLYLAAAKRLEAAGLFRGFRAEKRLGKGKAQEEKAAVPAAVRDLPATAIKAWTKGDAPAKEAVLRRRMASRIWEAHRYLAFSRELTRYLVDTEGKVRGDDPILAAGAFLAL
ncbi:MAG: alkaline phosphatase family protein [Betaproteobacteria bacterium]